jgi:hypothetical protein
MFSPYGNRTRFKPCKSTDKNSFVFCAHKFKYGTYKSDLSTELLRFDLVLKTQHQQNFSSSMCVEQQILTEIRFF